MQRYEEKKQEILLIDGKFLVELSTSYIISYILSYKV